MSDGDHPAISEDEIAAIEQRCAETIISFVTTSEHVHGGTNGRIETTYSAWQTLCDLRNVAPRLIAEIHRLQSLADTQAKRLGTLSQRLHAAGLPID